MMELSIIIPAYNVEQYIEACIESIYRQGLDETRFEVVVVNDGSKDNTLSIVKSLAERHGNIIVVDKPNGGQSQSRNVAMTRATGKYILFVDSDDVLIDGTVSTLLETAMRNDTDMCRGGFVKMTDEEIAAGLPRAAKNVAASQVCTGLEAFARYYNPDESYVMLFLFRRTFLTDNGMKFIEGKLFEDVAFTQDCYVRAKRFVDVPLPFYVYRQHTGTTMSTMNVKKLKDFNYIIGYTLNLSPLVNGDAQALAKLRFAAYRSASIVVWYLCNYRSLYPHSREVIADLKSKIGKLRFRGDIRQRLFSFCVNHIPCI